MCVCVCMHAIFIYGHVSVYIGIHVCEWVWIRSQRSTSDVSQTLSPLLFKYCACMCVRCG